MNLNIKPFHKNIYPLQGILIKNKDVKYWLDQLHLLKINLETTPVYAIPDTVPNSIWGCFIELDYQISNNFKAQNLYFCQSIQNKLFIPELAEIFPKLNPKEVATLFADNPHIFHPEFGLFKLDTPIDWVEVIEIEEAKTCYLVLPSDTPFYPKTIHKIEIKALPPEELLKSMEENIFPKKEKFKGDSLNWKEKIKYNLLKPIFKSAQEKTENKNWLQKTAKFITKLHPKRSKVYENLEQDFEDLEKRNLSEMEKLMNLFKNNPEEALKYAIPIDNNGTNRGGNLGSFSMSQQWSSFNLFGNNNRGSGNGNIVFDDDSFAKLQSQYYQAADNFVKDKNYEKAAFIYMKLLKNNQMAAQTLEDGKMYSEAASVYLKYLQNKEKAASCYESGKMTSNAIELYKELKMNEKVGDLYLSINNKKEAFEHYNIVIENYKTVDQYVKAALLYRNKLDDATASQEILLKGWRLQKDGFNCLNNYFKNIENINTLSMEIDKIYKNDINIKNIETFLKVLKYEHKKDYSIAIKTKKMAYEIVSNIAKQSPTAIDYLSAFNQDKELYKDITRFKTRK